MAHVKNINLYKYIYIYKKKLCYQLKQGLPCLVERPCVARVVLQTPLSVSQHSFSSKSLKHNTSQTIRPRDLTF